MGAAFAILKDGGTSLTDMERALLFIVLVLLLLAVLCSVGVLWPREVSAKPLPSLDYVDEFLGEDPPSEAGTYWNDRLRAWNVAVGNVAATLSLKASWLIAAQMLTAAAVAAFAVFLFLYFG